jgi:L-iditol 2-dehydrogenase
MKVAKLHGVHDFRVEQAPMPEPGPGEVVLRVRAVGLCGSDVHYYKEGGIGDATVNEPMTIGHEFAAQIADLGPGVAGLRVGQAVAVDPARPCGHCEFCLEGKSNLCPQVIFAGSPPVNGALTEYMVYPGRFCYPLPSGLSYDDGAVLEPLGVAIHAVDLGKPKTGHSVAVLGCGPIGLLTVQVARVAGASRIFATETLDYRLKMAGQYGATALYNPKTEDVVARILDDTKGRGVDVVWEAAGAQETVEQAMRIAKPGGTVVIVGIPSVDTTTFTASVARRKGLTIKMARRMLEVYDRAMALVEHGQVDVRSLVTHHFSLEQINQAFDTLVNYREGIIKAIVEM